jgi:hypothetical protein
MAACTPSIHVFLGRPLFHLSRGMQFIINFGILYSCILLTWSYRCGLFCSIITTNEHTCVLHGAESFLNS